MIPSKILCICGIGLLGLSVYAQDVDLQRKILPFPVLQQDASPIEFPFLGGFNAPKIQFADINADSFPDLFVQEEIGTFNQPGRLIFFQNNANLNKVEFTWQTDWYMEIDIGNWFKFVDFDGDGDLDLFTESKFSLMKYYSNEGTAENADFVLQADSLRDIQDEFIFFDSGSLPEMVDIDCDGDIDLLVGRSAQGTISLYENNGFLIGNIPQFENVPGNFQNISIIGEGGLNTNKINSAPNADFHGTNGLSIVDIDSDNDPDIFWGDANEPSLVFLKNSGTCRTPDIDIFARQYPPAAPLESGGFNVPRFADIDRDGDLDMFVSILGGFFSTTRALSENLYFYENTNSALTPEFQLKSRQFISTIDLGSNSAPAFVDIDGDGDQDLFVGNELEPGSSGATQSGQLYFYENSGSAQSPQFSLKTDNFADLAIGFNYASVFVDIDSDLDFDLFIGEKDGKLSFLENSGSPQSPQFVSVVENYAGIDVGTFNTPAFFDYDGDGDFDLFMGRFLGQVQLWENIGNPTSPQFIEQTKTFADIDVGEHSTPTFGDLDDDGDQDLLVGSREAGVFFYRNSSNTGQANFILDQNAMTIRLKNRSTPAVADINADGDADLFTGSQHGGLLFFENKKFATSVKAEHVLPGKFKLSQNFPNPFNPQTVISYQLAKAAFVNLSIYNLAGQKIRNLANRVQTPGQYKVTWNGKNEREVAVPSGIYFFRLKAGGLSQTRKMVLTK